jgi:hypothetical protein
MPHHRRLVEIQMRGGGAGKLFASLDGGRDGGLG